MQGNRVNFILYSLIFLNFIILTKLQSPVKFDDKSKDAWKEVSGLTKKPIERLEVNCTTLKECYSSEKFVLVCGSDAKQYWNPGVFQCAQSCNPGLTVRNFGLCKQITTKPTTTTEKVSDFLEGENMAEAFKTSGLVKTGRKFG